MSLKVHLTIRLGFRASSQPINNNPLMSLPLHAGLLRDEIVTLRHIFGYAGDSALVLRKRCLEKRVRRPRCETSCLLPLMWLSS